MLKLMAHLLLSSIPKGLAPKDVLFLTETAWMQPSMEESLTHLLRVMETLQDAQPLSILD